MAKKRSKLGTILVLSVFVLAAYGGYVIWNKKEVKSVVHKVEKSAKAAQKVW